MSKGVESTISFTRLLLRLVLCLAIFAIVLLTLPSLGRLHLSASVVQTLSWSLMIVLIISAQFVIYRNTSRKQKTFLTVFGFVFMVVSLVIMGIVYGDKPIPIFPWGIFEMFFLIVGLTGLVTDDSSK